MKIQLRIYAIALLSNFIMAAAAQSSTQDLSVASSTTTTAPPLSRGVQELQRAEEARSRWLIERDRTKLSKDKSPSITHIMCTYDVFRHLGNIRSSGVATALESDIIARSIIRTVLLKNDDLKSDRSDKDLTSFKDLAAFYLISSQQLESRIAYLAVSAWAKRWEDNLGQAPIVLPRKDEIAEMVKKHSEDLQNHWLGREQPGKIVELFRKSLDSFHDLARRNYDKLAKKHNELKEGKATTLPALPEFYRNILEKLNKGYSPSESHLNSMLWNIAGKNTREFDEIVKEYKFALPQTYDLMGILYLGYRFGGIRDDTSIQYLLELRAESEQKMEKNRLVKEQNNNQLLFLFKEMIGQAKRIKALTKGSQEQNLLVENFMKNYSEIEEITEGKNYDENIFGLPQWRNLGLALSVVEKVTRIDKKNDEDEDEYEDESYG